MSTFERDPVIASLASRASDQVKAGLNELHAGNLLAAEVFLNAAAATMQSLVVLLDGTQPVKPMRRLAVVGAQEEAIPEWMESKKGGPDGAA